jgi:predicted nuclease of predicted toxin-antitoxin system
LSLRFKLDENADPRWRVPLEQAGHTVSTTAEESLNGTDDRTLAAICRSLGFCLITSDLGFTQILDYPPQKYAGLIVLRHPKPTLKGMLDLIRQVTLGLNQESPAGQLWIVEPGRIRVHWSLEEASDS